MCFRKSPLAPLFQRGVIPPFCKWKKRGIENNSNQYLFSPRRERIEVRRNMIRTSTPTLALPRPTGEGIRESIFMVRG